MQIQRLLVPVFAAFALFLGACDDDDDDFIEGASLAVSNESDFAIYQLYLTEVDNPDWGPNLIAGDALFPGEEVVVGVPCDFYDALLVDADGVECTIFGIDLCLNDATWVIRNNTCTVFTAEAQKRAEAATRVDQASSHF